MEIAFPVYGNCSMNTNCVSVENVLCTHVPTNFNKIKSTLSPMI